MSAFKLFKLLPRFAKLFQFYLYSKRRATLRNLRAWNSNLGTTVRLIIFDGINTVNRARARIILVESSMLLKPHCVSSIPVRFHGCRELAPQIRSSLNGIATPVLEKRRQELSLLSRIFLTLAWLRYRPTTHFAKSRFKCGMGQVHFQSATYDIVTPGFLRSSGVTRHYFLPRTYWPALSFSSDQRSS